MVSTKLFALGACVSSALAATTAPYTTSRGTATGPAPYSTPPPVSTQTMWGLCGGLAFSFTGSVVCTSIASCAHFNSFYWQCIPPATTTAVITTTSSTRLYPTTTAVSLTLPPVSSTTTKKTTLSTITATQHPAVPVYGQCGGQGFLGNTVCVAGATCVKLNQYFSQCLPNNSTTAKATATKSV